MSGKRDDSWPPRLPPVLSPPSDYAEDCDDAAAFPPPLEAVDEPTNPGKRRPVCVPPPPPELAVERGRGVTFWLVVCGVVVAALAFLGGFLGASAAR